MTQANEQTVVAVGQARGESSTNIVIALMTAQTESGFQNYANSNIPESLTYPHDAVGSDHNSLGIFQQQTPGWGTVAELMAPATAAGKFYDALDKAPKGLSPWLTAQKVQVSAYADGSNYEKNYSTAQNLYAQLSGGQTATSSPVTTASILDPFAAAQTFFSDISSATFWERVGVGVLGGTLVGFAVVQLMKNVNVKLPTPSIKGLTNARP